MEFEEFEERLEILKKHCEEMERIPLEKIDEMIGLIKDSPSFILKAIAEKKMKWLSILAVLELRFRKEITEEEVNSLLEYFLNIEANKRKTALLEAELN
jgi:hypothetical protein